MRKIFPLLAFLALSLVSAESTTTAESSTITDFASRVAYRKPLPEQLNALPAEEFFVAEPQRLPTDDTKKAWSETELRAMIRDEVSTAIRGVVKDAVREALAEQSASTPKPLPVVAAPIPASSACGSTGYTMYSYADSAGACGSMNASAGACASSGSSGRMGLFGRLRSRCGR